MSEENDRPNPTDADAGHGANAAAGGEEGDSAAQKADGQEQAGLDLSTLNEALGRDFKTTEDAIKSLKNLNSLVGDQKIQELKKKAETADIVDKLVRKIASEKGVSHEDALKSLQEEAAKVPNVSTQDDEKVRELAETVKSLKMRAEERDLLDAHPEAKHVLKDLKTLASATGQSLVEAFESSNMKALAESAAAHEERKNRGTGVIPSSRSAVPTGDFSKAEKAFKENPTGENADRMVAAALGKTLGLK